MDRLLHLAIAVLIVIFNHCSGEKTFTVELVSMPQPGNTLVDLSEEDASVKKCDVKQDGETSRHFVCNHANLILTQPFSGGVTVTTVKVMLETTEGKQEGLVTIKITPSDGYWVEMTKGEGVPEEMKPGTKVSSLFSVKGLKAGDKVSYSLTGGDDKYLGIDKTTGEITSIMPLDRDGETGKKFIDQLKLTVVINGDKTLTKELNISVLDINDNSPTFIKNSWTVKVPENSTKYPIATLKCTDDDEGDNARVVQSISSSPDPTLFSISGDSLLAETLDFEGPNKMYNLTVIAVDQPKQGEARTGTATVHVMIQPKNEFEPVWEQPFQGGSGSAHVHTAYKNTKAGDVIFTLSAVDMDDGDDGQISYAIMKTENASGDEVEFIFHIDPSKGDVHVISNLSEAPYTLTVSASDNGTPNKSINATITIPVTDPPKEGLHWHHGKQAHVDDVTVVLPKTTKPGNSIVKVVAEGAPGDTSDISYKLGPVKKNGKTLETNMLFYVDQKTGSLIPLRDFKYFLGTGVDFYQILVNAETTKGSEKITIHCTVTVEIPKKTVNHAPEWVEPFAGGNGASGSVTVPEDIEPGSAVATIKAVDADSGAAGDVTYRIGSIATEGGVDVTDQFGFDPQTGILTILSDLDLEKGVKLYTVMISALDKGDPPKTTQGILKIHVSDVNEHNPSFDKNFYNAKVTCDINEGDDILRIKMTDKDATSRFTLTSTPTSRYVILKMLQSGTAAVFLGKRPSSEMFESSTVDEFLTLKLSDGGKPEKTAQGFIMLKFMKCLQKSSPTTTVDLTTKVIPTKPRITKKPDIVTKPEVTTKVKFTLPRETNIPPVPETTKPSVESTTDEGGLPGTTEDSYDGNTTDDDDLWNSTVTDGGVVASSEPPRWLVPSSQASGATTPKSHSTNLNGSNPNHGASGGGTKGGGSDSEAGNWVVRSLCIILFLGYVAMGGIYIAKKFSLFNNANCLRPKTAVHPRPEGENDTNDNPPAGSVVDYSDRQADNMPDITAALAVASPNFMDSYSREVPQPPVSATPSVALSGGPPATPLVTVPLPPIPSIQTQPPPAVPPLSTTTSQMPPRTLPPLTEIPR